MFEGKVRDAVTFQLGRGYLARGSLAPEILISTWPSPRDAAIKADRRKI